jgi:hypothetical protein
MQPALIVSPPLSDHLKCVRVSAFDSTCTHPQAGKNIHEELDHIEHAISFASHI